MRCVVIALISHITESEMGADCSSYPPPDPNTTNHCNDYDDTYYMKDFCSCIPACSQTRIQWCGKLGANGEWGVQNSFGTHDCYYNTCRPYQVMNSAFCCSGCCGKLGKSSECIRKEFTGDPIKCCLQDKVCTAGLTPPNSNNLQYAPAQCFSDTAKQHTCSPCHRDITSQTGSKPDNSKTTCFLSGNHSCQELLLDYCSGADLEPGDTSWIQRWYDPSTGLETPMSCPYALKRNLFQDIGCNAANITFPSIGKSCTPFTAIPMSTQGVTWGRELMTEVFDRYRSDGFIIGANPGSPGYNPFEEYLYRVCCSSPLLCNQGLRTACSQYSSQRISLNPGVANWCGCYLPEDEYNEYVNLYQVNKECTPMCNRSSSIPIVTGDNHKNSCNQTICLINDVAIDLVSSTVGGGVTITQMCSNCSAVPGSTSSCTCILANNSIEAVNARIGGGIDISQQCGSTMCSVENPDGSGSLITLPCSEITDPNSDYNVQLNGSATSRESITTYENLTKIAIVVIAIAIIVLAFLLLLPPPESRETKLVTLKTTTSQQHKLRPSGFGGGGNSSSGRTDFSSSSVVGSQSIGSGGSQSIGSQSIGSQSIGSGSGGSGSSGSLSSQFTPSGQASSSIIGSSPIPRF